MPTFSQIFVAASSGRLVGMALERLAFCLRKRAEHETDVYFPSLSSRTIAYKGMLTTDQLDHFYPDLVDERVASAVAVVHSRFSTNTFPSWPLSHPFRFIAHNGEINTVMGNRNWMRAREALLSSDLIPGDLDRLLPDLLARRLGLRVLRRGARAAAHGRPHAAALGADDDPRGVGEPRRDGQGPPCVLRVPRLDDGAVGRPGRAWSSPTAPRSARCSTATACARPATGSPTTAWSCWPPRSASSTSTRRRWSARAACSPAGCSSWTPPSTGSSRTRRSRASSPPSTRTTSGCTPASSASRTSPTVSTSCTRTPRSPVASRSSATPRRRSASSSRRWPRPVPSRSARWAPTPRSRRSRTGRGCCSTTSRSCSRRSPTRRWTRSARSSSPRCRG